MFGVELYKKADERDLLGIKAFGYEIPQVPDVMEL